ncbi:MAG: hypothetical protein H6970_03740 [Gammaproteobacteria bacterium]|nr:hypothetical protein [Gammaproteobacteria bacterium]MCP5424162.1 hypothetical protein [Gammaproteobacteria bacterium]
MQLELILGADRVTSGRRAEDYLRHEIAFYESRLTEMGEKGDCAYEHALSRAYRSLLQERREQLANL